MRRQAEISAAMQVAWQEKQEAEEQRRAAREAEAKEVSGRCKRQQSAAHGFA
jgi:hypothetical protein